MEPEPPKKRMALLLIDSESEFDDEALFADITLDRYRTEPSVSTETCPLQWWSAHTGANGKLAQIAQRYLITPVSTVPCQRLFSLAVIVQKKRSALSSENVNQLVCLHNWLKEK